MSKPDEEARLDHLVDEAVEQFLLVPDKKVLDRVEELTGSKDALAIHFDRLMAPILNQHKPQPNRDLRIQSAASLTSTWRRFLAWNPTRTLFSRPMRSVFASLVLVIVGVSLSFPLWRTALGPDSNNVDQTSLSRNVPKEDLGDRPAASSTGGDSVYVAQLVRSTSFAAAAEALDRIKARYPSLLKDQSLMIRKADSGEGAYIGGVGGLKSEHEAEQLCGRIRASGDRCKVLSVPKE